VLTVGLALASAFCNALASVLQRAGVRRATAAREFRRPLLLAVLRQPVWLAGLAAMTGGFGFQATALGHGDLALVQPLLLTELPITFFLAGVWFKVRPERRAWLGVAGISAGLAASLLAADPSGGTSRADVGTLLLALGAGLGCTALAIAVALRLHGNLRSACFALAAGIGFALTAAVMKSAAYRFSQDGATGLLSSWQCYATVAAGVLSLYIWQHALAAGTLAAAQPAIMLADPVVATTLGVLVFNEHIRLGAWLLAEFVGAALVVAGGLELARSPLITGPADAPQNAPGPDPPNRPPAPLPDRQ
jgi:drug/metabolite transporter (DMT)-like permease